MKRAFTTITQSKYLLGKGIPADTCDCCYDSDDDTGMIMVLPQDTLFSEFAGSIKKVMGKELIPCWSVYALYKIDTILNLIFITDNKKEANNVFTPVQLSPARMLDIYIKNIVSNMDNVDFELLETMYNHLS